MASLRVTREAVADYLLGDYVSYAFRHTLRRLVSAPPDCPREDGQTGERYSAYQLRNVRSERPFLARDRAILGHALCRTDYPTGHPRVDIHCRQPRVGRARVDCTGGLDEDYGDKRD